MPVKKSDRRLYSQFHTKMQLRPTYFYFVFESTPEHKVCENMFILVADHIYVVVLHNLIVPEGSSTFICSSPKNQIMLVQSTIWFFHLFIFFFNSIWYNVYFQFAVPVKRKNEHDPIELNDLGCTQLKIRQICSCFILNC